ncbi:hypothetical protein [Streptomyces sp. NPDC093225]|uniref:hypothetical protein n=1 Tax=Streptomyces sp. NPDC093225 TaxID=3366034 RepID=UPI00381F28DC
MLHRTPPPTSLTDRAERALAHSHESRISTPLRLPRFPRLPVLRLFPRRTPRPTPDPAYDSP